jgi:putative ABC transport system permease protein
MRVDEIKYSLENILHKKTRSVLTTLSILIGIMAVFALISFGLGIKVYTNTLAQQAGSDKLLIMSKGFGASGGFEITKDDLDFISKINGVIEVSGLYSGVAEMTSGKETRYASLAGYDTTKTDFVLQTFTAKLDKGRLLKKGETGKVLMGYNYQLDKKVFTKALKLNDRITINGQPFEIVGFFQSMGNPSDDTNVYISYESMVQLYPSTKDKYVEGIIRADKGVKPSDLADKITEKLGKHLGVDKGKEAFFVQTFEDLLATFGTIINIINGVLVLIALISVVVAAVNIMNTMYTAVLERTKEIGIMKAIGARNNDILNIFIFESGMLGIIGGALGVLLGFLVAKIGEAIAAGAGLGLLKPVFPWYLIAGCLLFSFLVGAGSGVLPARQAAAQKPVDSLRYE